MSVFYVESGRIRTGGEDIKEFGVNSPDLLIRWLAGRGSATPEDPWPRTSTKARRSLFQLLSDNGVRAIRFAPFGTRPRSYQASFVNDQKAFLDAFDELVCQAEEFNMALAPSLFFSAYQIPPLFGETLGAFAVPGTRSFDEFERVIETIVPRYRASRAIGYWEFGNEADIRMGIPSPGYAIDPLMGTPAAWTRADGTPMDYCHIVTARFQKLVRYHDRDPIGDAKAPRMIASGLQGWRIVTAQRNNWQKTLNERFFDDQTETLTLHPYEVHGWHALDYSGLMIYLRMLRENMEMRGKPVVIGEFGVPFNYQYNGISAIGAFSNVLEQIGKAGIQLSLLWNVPTNPGTDPLWDFHPRNSSCAAFWELFAKSARMSQR